jgi:hypothetical protein
MTLLSVGVLCHVQWFAEATYWLSRSLPWSGKKREKLHRRSQGGFCSPFWRGICFTWEIVSILVHLVSKLPQQNKCDNETLSLVVQVDDNAYHNAHNDPYHAPFIHTPHYAKATKIHTMILMMLIPSKKLNLLYNDNKVMEKVTLSFTSYPLFQQ